MRDSLGKGRKERGKDGKQKVKRISPKYVTYKFENCLLQSGKKLGKI